jgi:uncharacterized protein YkwD
LLTLAVAVFACAYQGAPTAGAAVRTSRREQRCTSRSPWHPRGLLGVCLARTTSPEPRGHSGRRVPTTPAPSTPNATGLARAVTIARVLSTPCQNAELLPEAGNLEAIRVAVLCLINRVRAENGETPLALDGQLEQVAQEHTQEMITADYFEHVSPSGVTPVQRDQTSGYIPGPDVGYVIGENLAWGTLNLATPQSIVDAWIASPAHLANILEGQYRDTGIGVLPEVPAALANGAPGATYAQEFGVIIR